MPDSDGRLTDADVPIINTFFAKQCLDRCLTCPIIGARIPITQWQISDRLLMLQVSGRLNAPDTKQHSPMLCCTSPAGGVVLIDAIAAGILIKAQNTLKFCRPPRHNANR